MTSSNAFVLETPLQLAMPREKFDRPVSFKGHTAISAHYGTLDPLTTIVSLSFAETTSTVWSIAA